MEERMGSTELARTVVLLAVEALDMSRRKTGRSAWGARCEVSGTVGSSVTESEALEALVLLEGEGLAEVGVERGMADA